MLDPELQHEVNKRDPFSKFEDPQWLASLSQEQMLKIKERLEHTLEIFDTILIERGVRLNEFGEPMK